MRKIDPNRMMACAVRAAHEAGSLMRRNMHLVKRIASEEKHDVKLDLDVRCQKAIEVRLRAAFPEVAILGEEGESGDERTSSRWVVDPIDGTVNFSYGIPHACVSIAWQTRRQPQASAKLSLSPWPFESILGVVYDPFCQETWTAIRGKPARLNGKVIRSVRRRTLDRTILSIGFAKHAENLDRMLPVFNQLAGHARKIRMMGSAALGLVYVASGRFDAYIETGLRLWDIAAGGLILECAGGEFWRRRIGASDAYRVVASNPILRRQMFRQSPQLRTLCQDPDLTV